MCAICGDDNPTSPRVRQDPQRQRMSKEEQPCSFTVAGSRWRISFDLDDTLYDNAPPSRGRNSGCWTTCAANTWLPPCWTSRAGSRSSASCCWTTSA